MSRRPLITSGTLLGIGMGGFVDGILFHQILQLHNMLSERLPPITVVNLEINMFWDGLFHAFAWTTTAIGIAMLWWTARNERSILSTGTFIGSLSLGWGLFNIVEGIIDHHLLQVHHVVHGEHQLVADLAFLGSGGLLIAIGGLIIGRDRAAGRPPACH